MDRIIKVPGNKLTKKQLDIVRAMYTLLHQDQRQYNYIKEDPQGTQAHIQKNMKWFADPKRTLHFYTKDGDVAGMLAYSPDKMWSDAAYLGGFYVDPKYRNSGIGTKLLQSAQKIARKDKLKKLVLMYYGANPASNLYNRYGFRPFQVTGVKQLDNQNVAKPIDRKRQMLLQIAELANKYKQPIFAVTQGASITRNNGSEAVRAARQAHAKWEDQHGGDSKQDWLKKSSKAIQFPIEQLPALKQRLTEGLPVYTTRVSSDYNKYSKGDSLNSTLGKLKVADQTKLDTLSEHPFIQQLTVDQRQLLAKYKKLKLLKLILEQSR